MYVVSKSSDHGGDVEVRRAFLFAMAIPLLSCKSIGSRTSKVLKTYNSKTGTYERELSFVMHRWVKIGSNMGSVQKSYILQSVIANVLRY